MGVGGRLARRRRRRARTLFRSPWPRGILRRWKAGPDAARRRRRSPARPHRARLRRAGRDQQRRRPCARGQPPDRGDLARPLCRASARTGCWTSPGPGRRARSATSRSSGLIAPRWRPARRTPRTGAPAPWPRPTGMSQTTVSRIWRAFALQPHRAETLQALADPPFVDKVRDVVGLYLTRPIARWCCASTRSRRSRRSSAPPRCCRCAPAKSSATPTTTSGTAPPTCSPRSTCRPARSSAPARGATARRVPRLPRPGRGARAARPRRPPRARQRRHPQDPSSSRTGWPSARAGICTSRPPRPPGSTWSRAGSRC